MWKGVFTKRLFWKNTQQISDPSKKISQILDREIWDRRYGGFQGCSNFSGNKKFLKFLGTNPNSTKITIGMCTARYRGIWDSRYGGFQGCSNFSGNCHPHVHTHTYYNIHIYTHTRTHTYTRIPIVSRKYVQTPKSKKIINTHSFPKETRHDISHAKYYNPEIHQIEKQRFRGISR